jgi:hypothetical protein
MSILTVNLKHLYQRRAIWVVYAFLGLSAFWGVVAPKDHPGAGKGQYIGLVALAFVIGFLVAALPIEVVIKPFSYCLPGHRKVARKFIFSVGAVINLLGSLLFLRYPGLNSWQLALVVCSAFFAGLIFYWLGVGLAFGTRNLAAVIGFLPLVIFGGGFLGLHVIIEHAIVENPFVLILAGVLSSVVVWFWLGDARLARRYCAVLWVGFFDAWNRDKLQKYRRVRAAIKWDKLKKHPSPWVETFFLGRMNGCGYFGTGRYIWGALYTAFPIALPQWKPSLSGLFVALLMVCFLGYTGPGINILFVMPALIIAQMRLPVYSSMLISGGRNERYRGAMTLVITQALLITTLVTIMAVLSVLLATIMPDIALRGITFAFHAMIIELFFVPLLMIPIVFTVQLIFYRKPIFMVLSIMLAFMLLFVTGTIWHKQLRAMIDPTSIASLVVLSWVLFLLVLRYICMRRCLVGQTRQY